MSQITCSTCGHSKTVPDGKEKSHTFSCLYGSPATCQNNPNRPNPNNKKEKDNGTKNMYHLW